MRVLISAYACEPGSGSEPGAGWAWCRAAAKRHEVWLLTRENNGPAIEAALRAEPDLRLHPVYQDLPRWARWWKKGQRGVHLYYLLWQLAAWRRAGRLHREVRFDVAHHLTFAVDWMPAAVCQLGVPAVWGPVGGATGTPWRLWRWLGMRGLVGEAVRELVTGAARRLFGDPNARRAQVVVAQNADVAARFGYVPRLVVEPNSALDTSHLRASARRGDSREQRLRAVFAGRLLAWKGVRLAVAAIAHPDAAAWELHIYGDGPERKACKQLADRMGVADRVRFHGKVRRDEVLAAIGEADAFLFPSMHDSAPWAVAEAVALGIPVVCLDRGGPPILASAPEHIRVPVSNTVVADLARALAQLRSRPRPEPSDRWDADRLPDLVFEWYELATSTSNAAD